MKIIGSKRLAGNARAPLGKPITGRYIMRSIWGTMLARVFFAMLRR